MNLGFSKLIRELESEISAGYLPGAIQWADANHNDAWSDAIDRFETCLVECIKKNDFGIAKREAELYKTTVVNLIRLYKSEQGQTGVFDFLKSLEGSKPCSS